MKGEKFKLYATEFKICVVHDRSNFNKSYQK